MELDRSIVGFYTGPPRAVAHVGCKDSADNTVILYGAALVSEQLSIGPCYYTARMEMTPEEAEYLARQLMALAAKAKEKAK